MDISYIATTAVKFSIVYIVLKAALLVKKELRTHLWHIPGPESDSWIWGNLGKVEEDSGVVQERWSKEYGKTFKYKLLWLVRHIYITLIFHGNKRHMKGYDLYIRHERSESCLDAFSGLPEAIRYAC